MLKSIERIVFDYRSKMYKAIGLRNENSLVNFRVVFNSLALIHLSVVAVVTLSIDTTVDKDPRINSYHYIRWKLLTCWFNLLTLAYLPTRVYCDWKKGQGCGNVAHVKMLNKLSDVVMTSVLAPTTMYADVVFWLIYPTKPNLLAPPKLFINYMPEWAQHSLHTVSFFVILIDLALTPRRRPRSLKMHLTLMTAFILAYSAVLFHSLQRGEIVYAFLEHITVLESLLALLITFSFYLVVFKLQWTLVDAVWKVKHFD